MSANGNGAKPISEAATLLTFQRPSDAGKGGGNNGDGGKGRGGDDDGGDYWARFILERFREVYDRVERLLEKQTESTGASIKDLAELVTELASDSRENAVLIKTFVEALARLTEQNLALIARVAALEDLAAVKSSDAP